MAASSRRFSGRRASRRDRKKLEDHVVERCRAPSRSAFKGHSTRCHVHGRVEFNKLAAGGPGRQRPGFALWHHRDDRPILNGKQCVLLHPVRAVNLVTNSRVRRPHNAGGQTPPRSQFEFGNIEVTGDGPKWAWALAATSQANADFHIPGPEDDPEYAPSSAKRRRGPGPKHEPANSATSGRMRLARADCSWSAKETLISATPAPSTAHPVPAGS